MKSNPALPGGSLKSKPTWSNTFGCSATSAFFVLGDKRRSEPIGKDSLGIKGCQRCRLMPNERTLQLSELRYRRVFEAAHDGILILNADTGAIEDANPFMTELLGYAHDQFVGRHLWEIGLFKDIEQSKAAFCELQEKGYIRYEDMPLQDKNGVHRQVEFVSNVYDVGDQKAIQCNIRDITERKLAEQQLAYFSAIVNASQDAIIGKTLEFIVTSWNAGAERLYGYTAEEAIGRVDWDSPTRRSARRTSVVDGEGHAR